MGAWRAAESVSLRTLRSTTPSTARPRAVDGALGFRFSLFKHKAASPRRFSLFKYKAASPDTEGEFGERYGTGSGSDLAPSEVVARKAPGRYRSLYRTNSPAVSGLAALHTPQRSSHGYKNQKVGVNPLYPHHPHSMNPYIHLMTALTLKQGPMCDRSGRRSRSSAPLHQQAWEHAYESPLAKPAADLQCGRRP